MSKTLVQVFAEEEKNRLPKVDKHVPIPNVRLLDGRNRQHKPSKWRAFLLGLEMGDSFVVEWPECSSVRSMARLLEVYLVHVALPGRGPNGRPHERYWRVTKGKLDSMRT